MYPDELVKPMREELSNAGFTEIHSAQEVSAAINKKGTTLFIINSVCGCAANAARPGVVMSLKTNIIPNQLNTVFAGVDIEATAKVREKMIPFPPSSPSVALFKDGELVHILERHHIEGRSAEAIAKNLQEAYNEFCKTL